MTATELIEHATEIRFRAERPGRRKQSANPSLAATVVVKLKNLPNRKSACWGLAARHAQSAG
jgi:hypothetical protein